MPFLENRWYVAGWPGDFGDALVSRTICGNSVVIHRRKDGSLAALEDRCAHRHIPLSRGKKVGDLIECAYHGLRFGPDGHCVHVPGQEDIPGRASIAAYPMAEKHGWAWIWIGDAKLADPKAIPDFHWLGDPAYAATGETKYIACDY